MTHVLTRLDYDDVASDTLAVSDNIDRLKGFAEGVANEPLDWQLHESEFGSFWYVEFDTDRGNDDMPKDPLDTNMTVRYQIDVNVEVI